MESAPLRAWERSGSAGTRLQGRSRRKAGRGREIVGRVEGPVPGMAPEG